MDSHLPLNLMMGAMNINMTWFRSGHQQRLFLIKGGCWFVCSRKIVELFMFFVAWFQKVKVIN